MRREKNNLVPFAGILIKFDQQIVSTAILEQAFGILLNTTECDVHCEKTDDK